MMKKTQKTVEPAPAKWVPIAQFRALDYDEEAKKFVDSMHLIELRQNTRTKNVQAIIVGD